MAALECGCQIKSLSHGKNRHTAVIMLIGCIFLVSEVESIQPLCNGRFLRIDDGLGPRRGGTHDQCGIDKSSSGAEPSKAIVYTT